MKQYICVFGASSEKASEEYKSAAFELGKLIAQHGYGMVFGAGRYGVMGAAARGAHSQNGDILGVIPERLNLPGIVSEHCTEVIVTPTMHVRKETMEQKSTAFVTLAGGFGTFEELTEVITLKQLGYIDAPIVILNTCNYYDDIIAMFKRCISERFADASYANLYFVAKNPAEAIEYIENYVPAQVIDKVNAMMRDKSTADI